MRRDTEGNLVFENLTEWRANTNYTDTTVSTSRSQAEIQRLLIDEWKAEQVVISERQGGQVLVGFEWKGKRYVIPVRRARIRGETQAQIAKLQRQAMRVLYWYLKNLLLVRFLTSEEELLMPHMMLETPRGDIRVADAVLGGLLRPALGSGDDPVEGDFREVPR